MGAAGRQASGGVPLLTVMFPTAAVYPPLPPAAFLGALAARLEYVLYVYTLARKVWADVDQGLFTCGTVQSTVQVQYSTVQEEMGERARGKQNQIKSKPLFSIVFFFFQCFLAKGI